MPGPGLTVFILFFGVGLLDAVGSGNWLRAAFWLAVGTAFWFLDQERLRRRR